MELTATIKIEEKIHTIREVQVMFDSDLAAIYQVETRVLNQAVKRNNARFPSEFMFQITQKEWDDLMSYKTTANLTSQAVISSSHGGRYSPSFPNCLSRLHCGKRLMVQRF